MKKSVFILTSNTRLVSDSDDAVILRSVKRMYRDMQFILSKTDGTTSTIRLIHEAAISQEGYCIEFPNEKTMHIKARDSLGFTYALLFLSEQFLQITPFWFWNDQQFHKKTSVDIPIMTYTNPRYNVAYRGWFINDEVLLDTWKVNGCNDYPWEMVFEALLRCGGNMTIPGTDKTSIKYRCLASDMGLWISQHHAEPLGGEMFSRVYPELNPSFDEHPELFRKLWREAIASQKNMKVIWNLGFRGQGDCPFWANDPKYANDKDRGELISRLIQEQYELVKAEQPDAICCVNLYGETMELYREGWIDLAQEIIKIWADNGYGKMVSRRQGLHNPRVNAEPKKGLGRQGIYYHVSFYDLQAANHITMATNAPTFYQEELKNVLANDGNSYWMINASNIKPHIYYLDFIARMWREGDIDVHQHRMAYANTYYGKAAAKTIADSLKAYGDAAVFFGEHTDEHIGEQYINHNTRILASQWWSGTDQAAREFLWASKAQTLEEQIAFYKQIAKKGVDNYTAFERRCEYYRLDLEESAKQLFEDSLMLHGRIYAKCFQGAYAFCIAYEKYSQKAYQEAFYFLGRAAEFYGQAYEAMTDCEHDKWIGFYANDCLTDIRQTAWILKELMGYVRNLGDGPHFYKWKREFMYSEQDRNIMLLLVHERHIDNGTLYQFMKARGGFTW
ncbi:glycosyl hydrolase 115 family protein [Vallitaleaceae bacterium 9-2]